MFTERFCFIQMTLQVTRIKEEKETWKTLVKFITNSKEYKQGELTTTLYYCAFMHGECFENNHHEQRND